jgi:hypothetical protein
MDAWSSGIAEMGDKYRPPDAREGESITQYANRLGREAVEARKLLGGSNVDVSNTAGSTTKKIDPGAANALIALKGNPTPERIAAFKKYYPNDIGMLKTIGLK